MKVRQPVKKSGDDYMGPPPQLDSPFSRDSAANDYALVNNDLGSDYSDTPGGEYFTDVISGEWRVEKQQKQGKQVPILILFFIIFSTTKIGAMIVSYGNGTDNLHTVLFTYIF